MLGLDRDIVRRRDRRRRQGHEVHRPAGRADPDDVCAVPAGSVGRRDSRCICAPPAIRCRSRRRCVRKSRSSIASATVFNIRTAEEDIGRSLLRERLVATITTLFGGLALLLAAIGLYGVLSYGVAQRTREFGIRIAIGAEAGSIVRLVMREAGWVVGGGIAVGLAAAWALGRVGTSLLYGIQPTDPVSAVIAVAVLAAAGALAAWIPARRASRVDPIRALRYE